MTVRDLDYYHADGRLVMIKNSDIRGLSNNKIDSLNYDRMVDACIKQGGNGKLSCCHIGH